MTALQERVLRELVDCVDGRASGCALRLTIKLGAAAWATELRELEVAGWVVEDRWAPSRRRADRGRGRAAAQGGGRMSTPLQTRNLRARYFTLGCFINGRHHDRPVPGYNKCEICRGKTLKGSKRIPTATIQGFPPISSSWSIE